MERDGGFSPKCRFALSAILTEPVSNPLKLCLTGWAKLKGIRHATAVCAAVRWARARWWVQNMHQMKKNIKANSIIASPSALPGAVDERDVAVARAILEPFQPRFV